MVKKTDAKRIRVCILALPFAGPASIYCAHDDLAAVGMLGACFGMPGDQDPAYSVRIVAATRDVVMGAAGSVEIRPHKAIDEVDVCDMVFVPAMLPVPQWMSECGGGQPFDPSVLDWIVKQYDQGALIVSLCNGAYVLAETGLLNGRPATTHWASLDDMQARYPRIQVEGDRPIIETGEGGRIVTAGTGLYHSDLILYLIQRQLGRAAAHEWARISGKFWMGDSQDVFARMSERGNNEDAVVRQAQNWFAENLNTSEPVRKMAERTNLTNRTFARRFKEATGQTPLGYVQSIRVEHARQMLESSRVPVSEIADRVGYKDVGSFSKIFQRLLGLSPGEYRKRFKLPPEKLCGPARDLRSSSVNMPLN